MVNRLIYFDHKFLQISNHLLSTLATFLPFTSIAIYIFVYVYVLTPYSLSNAFKLVASNFLPFIVY